MDGSRRGSVFKVDCDKFEHPGGVYGHRNVLRCIIGVLYNLESDNQWGLITTEREADVSQRLCCSLGEFQLLIINLSTIELGLDYFQA